MLSLQLRPLLLNTQPVVTSQESLVHTLLSLQTTSVPPQLPPLQTSPLVHALLSLQGAVLKV